MQPDVVILAEATSMLDPKGRKEVNDLVHELHANRDMTILSITHDIEEVTKSDYIIVMNKGKVFMQGKPESVLLNIDSLIEIGLDIPFDIEGMVDTLWQLNSKK